MNKRLFLPIAASVLALAAGACLCTGFAESQTDAVFDDIIEELEAGATSGIPTVDIVPTDIVPPTADLPAPAEAAPTEAAAGVGSFSTGDEGVADLPTLQLPATGIGPSFCNPEADSEPGFELIDAVADFKTLCVFGFDTSAGGPPITLVMTAPDGQIFTEVLSVVDNEGSLDIIAEGRANPPVGFISTGFPGEDIPPYHQLGLNFTGDLPAGAWSVSATDGTLSATTLVEVTFSKPYTTVSDGPPGVGPLYQPDVFDTGISQSRPAFIAGRDYPANTDLRVAVYYELESLEGELLYDPLLSTTVTTDADGMFETIFTPGSETPSGAFYALVYPDDTVDGLIDPFVGRFQVP